MLRLCLAFVLLSLSLSGAVAQHSSEIITKTYDDGGIYRGTFRNGLQHGTGTYTLPNGYEYTGDWVAGQINGTGRAKFPDGSVYVGTFAKGKPHGQGQITFADGGIYKGAWQDGKISGQGQAAYADGSTYVGGFREAQNHGKGRLTRSDGYVYDGDWIDGKATGSADIKYADGAKYVGRVRDGERHGQGQLTLSDGRMFKGSWHKGAIFAGGTITEADGTRRPNGPLTGQGRLEQPNGAVFEAVFQRGAPHGRGRILYPDGSRYEGRFENGRRVGQARFLYANGDLFEGLYSNDERNGQGEFTGADGFHYIGNWANGKIAGEGRATYADGSVYVGAFAEDKANGLGKITYADGATYEGGWVDGVIEGEGLAIYPNGLTYQGAFKASQNHGFGIMTYPDGYRYEGNWVAGKRDGVGKATYADGTVYTGAFKAGKRHGFGKIVMKSQGFEYEGDWVEGEITGRGISRYSNGDVYEGDFAVGQRHGLGMMRYASGEQIYGRWEQGALAEELDLPKEFITADAQEPASEKITTAETDSVIPVPEVAEIDKNVRDPAPVPDGSHVALIVGNAAYQHATVLANPLNDASAVADRFRALGYDVVHVENADGNGFRRALGRFSTLAANAEIAVAFYAGHGIEMQGRNYLIPVDAQMESDIAARYETVALQDMTSAAQLASRLGVVLIDACRDNPFARTMARQRGTRALSRGLAPVEVSGAGLLISFAAEAGTTAADSAGGAHSPYTEALLSVLEQPDLEVGRMFRKLRAQVRKTTQGKQVPIERMQLPDEDVFLHRVQSE